MAMGSWILPLKPSGKPWKVTEQESEQCSQLKGSWQEEEGPVWRKPREVNPDSSLCLETRNGFL